MAKEYIGSQEHFEDEVNAYYDQKEKMERDMQKQYEKDVIKQMERDFYAQQTQHLEPTEEIAALIESAERKAFRGGMNYGRPKECGTSEEHANSAFNFWKEESK